MAKSGQLDVKATGYDTLRFLWTESSQSVENNTTVISWQMRLIAGEYGRIESSAQKAWKITVGGREYSGKNMIGIANNADKLLASGSTTVAHNADGSKTVAFSFSQQMNITFAGEWIGTKSGAGSIVLSAIPRATVPAVPQGIIGNNIKILTPAAAEGFTHTLSYTFGKLAGTIASGITDSITWKIPETFAVQIPNEVAGIGEITCKTYNGTVLIGTKKTAFAVTVPDTMIPRITSVGVDEAEADISERFGAYIQSRSKLRIVTDAEGTGGSTVKSLQIEVSGKRYTGADIVTDPIKSSGAVPVRVTAIDSRGRSAEKELVVNVLSYSPPAIGRFSAVRCDSSGETDDEGEFLKCNLQYLVSGLEGKNDCDFSIDYKKEEDTSWSAWYSESGNYKFKQELTNLEITHSADSPWMIRLVLRDFFAEKETVLNLPTAKPILDIHVSGEGMGIGKVCEKNALEVAWKAEFLSSVAAKKLTVGGVETPELVDIDNWDEAWKFPNGLGILRRTGTLSAVYHEWGSLFACAFPRIENDFFAKGCKVTWILSDAGNGEDTYGWMTESDGGGSAGITPKWNAVRVTNATGTIHYSMIGIGYWKELVFRSLFSKAVWEDGGINDTDGTEQNGPTARKARIRTGYLPVAPDTHYKIGCEKPESYLLLLRFYREDENQGKVFIGTVMGGIDLKIVNAEKEFITNAEVTHVRAVVLHKDYSEETLISEAPQSGYSIVEV